MSASPELRRIPLEALSVPISTTRIADCGDDPPRADDEGCRTPTAAQFKIPALVSCPPAPKKARISVPSCRRRLVDADFVRIRPEDIERLFRSPAPQPMLPAKKRKRREFEQD